LNRVDDVVVFHALSKDEVTEIVDLMLQRIRAQLEAQGLGIELTKAAKYLVVEIGYDPSMGARPLRRALRRSVEDPLAEKILLREFRAGDTVIVDAVNREIVFKLMEDIELPGVELASAVSGD
jgi:ATP-dependent Clp protease ATP-binding subunit ClpC